MCTGNLSHPFVIILKNERHAFVEAGDLNLKEHARTQGGRKYGQVN
jgi:hypothetical protein